MSNPHQGNDMQEKTMAEQKESSVLFSLKELMNLEEDRIKQEEAERRRKADAESLARAESDRRAREQEEARMRAEEDRRRSEEQRSREDAARLEAIRHAELEKARLEAENAARMEAMKRQQEHQLQLHAISQDEGKKKLKMIAGGAGLLLVLALVGGGMAIKSANDRQKQLETQLSQLNDEKAGVESKLRQAKTPEEVEALKAQIAEINTRIDTAGKNPAAAAPAKEVHRSAAPAAAPKEAPKPKPAKKCDCTPGDPLCSCL